MSTGIKKTILAKGKRKDCRILTDWAPGVSNHVYWCAASSGGDKELVRSIWQLVTRHVANIQRPCDHYLLQAAVEICMGHQVFSLLYLY